MFNYGINYFKTRIYIFILLWLEHFILFVKDLKIMVGTFVLYGWNKFILMVGTG